MSLNPQIRHIDLISQCAPSMRMNAGENFAQWQEKARAKLEQLLGLPMEHTAPNFRVEWEKEFDTYTEIRFLFDSEPEVTVSCHLLLPKGVEKVPVVICLQGHSKGMHISLGQPKYPGDEKSISGGDRDFARQIIARGQAALTVEQRAMGERGGTPEGPDCYQPSVQALLLGRTLLGERCWDISQCIDVVLEQFKEIDPERIAIMGNSGGGTTSLYAAALDTRIAAAMPSCAFSGFLPSIGRQYHCICNYVPNMAKHFDMGDIAGLVAPRPLIIVNGKDDVIFPLDSAKEQLAIAQKTYEAAGAADQLCHVVGNEGHRFYAAQGWPEFDRLTDWR